MSGIQLCGVAKRFGTTPVLTDIDLVVPARSMTAVLGASGSGKTTLLRLIAGFEQLDEGTISIGDRVVDDGRRAVRPQHRGVGYVPQDGALFPHLTVAGNVRFGVGRHDRGAGERTARPGRSGRSGAPLPPSALRRPAAAGRPGPGPGRAARCGAPRRALQLPRRFAAHRAAPRRGPHPGRDGHYHGTGHPRPGRGPGPGPTRSLS